MNLYNEDASALGFDDPQYIVDMWQTALDAQHEGYGMIPGEETAVTAFDSMVSDAWSRYQNSNELQAYRDSTGKDISMVMIPNMDDATASATYLKPAMFWCVGAQSEVKDAAIRFINFFTNDPACYDIVGIERAVPISSEMREHVAPLLDEVSQEVVDFVDYVSQPGMASPLMNPDPSCHSEVAELLSQYSEQVRYGDGRRPAGDCEQFMEEPTPSWPRPRRTLSNPEPRCTGGKALSSGAIVSSSNCFLTQGCKSACSCALKGASPCKRHRVHRPHGAQCSTGAVWRAMCLSRPLSSACLLSR